MTRRASGLPRAGRIRPRLAGRHGLAAIVWIALAQPGHAQSLEQLQQLSLEQLSAIRVSSVAKQSEPLSDAPAAIYVISHNDIVRSGATTLPEMLRLAPNLEVAQVSATNYAVTARGFNVFSNASMSNKLLILIDGRSVYSPMFGGIYWDMQEVPPENIDRIEVISGPGATLWGANAVNGVINIITRHSSATQGGLLTLGAGNLERSAAVQYGGRLGPDLTYRVHTEFSAFSAYPLANGQSAHDARSRPQGGFRLDWTPSNEAVTVEGNMFTVSEQPNGFIRGGNLLTHWRHRFDDGSSLQILAYYDDAQRYINDGGPAFWAHTYDIEVQHNFQIGSRNSIVWGAGERAVAYWFRNSTALQLVPADQTLNLANIFAQDTITLLPSLKLTLGTKLEAEPYAGVQVMPSARVAWKATDSLLLWAAVSRAVRSVTPVDSNLREFAGTLDVLNGSSSFRPETMTAYEAGMRVQVSERASFSVSAYYDVYDALRSINRSPTPSGLPFVFGNLMAGTVYGIEAWGSYRVADWWQLSAGMNLLHEDLQFLPGSTQVGGLAFVADDPGHQFTLHSSMDLGHGVTFDAFLRDVGALSHPVTPGYVELNARLGWAVNRWLLLSLSGFNLLHARHVEFIEPGQSVAVPRSVFAQAQVRF